MRRLVAAIPAALLWWLVVAPPASAVEAGERIPIPVQMLVESVNRFAGLATGNDEHRLLAIAAGRLEGSTLPPLDAARLAFDFMYDELGRIEHSLGVIALGLPEWTPDGLEAYMQAESAFRSVPQDLVRDAVARISAGYLARPPGNDVEAAYQDHARLVLKRGTDLMNRWDALLARRWPEPTTRPGKDAREFQLEIGIGMAGVALLSLALVLTMLRLGRWAGLAIALGAALSVPAAGDLAASIVLQEDWAGRLMVLMTAMFVTLGLWAGWRKDLPELPRMALQALSGRAAAILWALQAWWERRREGWGRRRQDAR